MKICTTVAHRKEPALLDLGNRLQKSHRGANPTTQRISRNLPGGQSGKLYVIEN